MSDTEAEVTATPQDDWIFTTVEWCMKVMPANVPKEGTTALYEMLAHELSADMIQTVPTSAGAARGGRVGYSEAGVVDRLNRVLGPGGWMCVTRVRQAAKVGNWAYALIDLVLWSPVLGRAVHGVGFGRGGDRADAEKGGATTAMKRAARMIGPGWQAYAGIVDPDLDVTQPPK